MTEVFTDVGLAYHQTLVTGNTPLVVNTVIVENLNLNQRFNAVEASRPVLADGHNRQYVYSSPSPLQVDVFQSATDISINLEIEDAAARTGWAAYIYAQGLADPFIVIADDTDAFFIKPANEPGLINVRWSIDQGVPSALTVNWLPFARATNPQAEADEANASDTAIMTVAKMWRWWNSISVAANKITGVLATARIPNLSANKITSGMLAFARLPAATVAEAMRGLVSDDDGVMTAYKTRLAIEELAPRPVEIGSANIDVMSAFLWVDTTIDAPASPPVWGALRLSDSGSHTALITFKWSDLSTGGAAPVIGISAISSASPRRVSVQVYDGLNNQLAHTFLSIDANGNFLFASDMIFLDPMPLTIYTL